MREKAEHIQTIDFQPEWIMPHRFGKMRSCSCRLVIIYQEFFPAKGIVRCLFYLLHFLVSDDGPQIRGLSFADRAIRYCPTLKLAEAIPSPFFIDGRRIRVE